MDLSLVPKSSSPNASNECDDCEIVERDPTGQYARYDEILGEGASKTVYKAFDEVNGTEVAWSKAEISDEVMKSDKQLKRLNMEAKLLKSLKHENVIRCFHSWVDDKNKSFNMITELLTSGNLRQYRKKHGLLDNRAIKNWARQILKGLDYLHSHDPPIVHRDLKCENIFVNGNSGKVKIGDMGLATALKHATVMSVIGTPEFMAPELYEEEYDQLVDIYSFGMCILEMVTRELPYSECKNSAQVYKKVTSGVKPDALDKVSDPQVRQFIEKCLAPASERSSAIDLLNDPFLALEHSGVITCSPSMTESLSSVLSTPPAPVELMKITVTEMNVYKLQGKKNDRDSIALTLWIADLNGSADRLDFVFNLQNDTVSAVTEEMAREMELSKEDTALIADFMEELITELVPDFRFSLEQTNGFSQNSTLSEDYLNLKNMPLKPPANEDQKAALLIPIELGGLDSVIQAKYLDMSSIQTDSGAYGEIVAFDQDQMQANDGIESQLIHTDKTLDNTRKGEGKCPKEANHNGASSFFRKLFCGCQKF